jgi:hypothetical protein
MESVLNIPEVPLGAPPTPARLLRKIILRSPASLPLIVPCLRAEAKFNQAIRGTKELGAVVVATGAHMFTASFGGNVIHGSLIKTSEGATEWKVQGSSDDVRLSKALEVAGNVSLWLQWVSAQFSIIV